MTVIVKGYHSEGEWNCKANGKYVIAEKGGKPYFLKQFDYCKWMDDTVAAKYPELKKLNERSDEIMKRMVRINTELSRIAGRGGDLVIALELFREDNVLYKVNEFVDMEDLDEKRVHECLTQAQIDACMVSVLQAVYALHKARIVHGDLKPANILFVKEGRTVKALVSDFDDSFFIGDVPASQDLISDNVYYSPELQFYISNVTDPHDPFSKVITGRSDIFSLGLVWHMYLTGALPELPHGCRTAAQACLEEKPLRLSPMLDEKHQKIIAKMLAPSPKDRYANCNEIISDLHAHTASAASSHATGKSRLEVIVADSSGTPVTNQDVTVGNAATRKYMTCRTDSTGHFTMELEPGIYVIGAENKDCPFRRETLEVSGGTERTFRFTMYRKTKAAEYKFDPPVNGRYTALTAADDLTWELTTVTGRKMTVYTNMLKLYGIDLSALERA